jgi:serine/threonine-protein kinase
MEERLVVDRYELVEELATGGMATVYIGRVRGAVGFARVVAIKRLHKQYAKNRDFVAMFLDEARLASRIRHPNVVPTLDVVAERGELFLVMEFVHGESLSAIARHLQGEGRAFPIPIAAAILSNVLQGLHAAHEARDEAGSALDIVHRDVSPQNILVGADGIARVVDFGISKATGRLQDTTEGQVKGKPAYMAPEQLSGHVDRRCDVYAAAVVLWELVTGCRLFTGESQPELITKVLAGAVPSPSSIAPEVGERLEEVILGGLDRAPDRRFPTAREMDRALKRATPIATSFEVAEWLEGTMADVFVSRAELLARVERGMKEALEADAPRWIEAASRVSRVEAGTPIVAENTPPSPRSRRSWIAASAFAIAIAAIAILVVSSRFGDRSRSASDLSATSSSSSSQGPDRGDPAPASAPAPAPASASAPASAPASAASNPAASSKRGPAGKKGGKPSCNPPFTVDAEGHRHFLVECL